MIIKGRTRINYRLYAFEPKEQEQLVSINYDVTTDGNVSVQLRVGEKAETSNMDSSQFKRKKESPIHYPTISSSQLEKKDYSILLTKKKTSARISRMYSECSDSNEPTATPSKWFK
jgi:hypothetical protein